MGAAYEFRLNTDLSQRLAVLGPGAWSSFRAIRVVNNVGMLELTIPYGVINPDWLRRDYIISVLRSLDGGPPSLLFEQNYLLRRVTFTETASEQTITLTGYDWNDLLRRRIIAYFAGSAQASKTAAADNMIKAFVRENLGATASDYAGSTARALAATRFAVQADLSLAPSQTKRCAWREPLLEVLREIAQTSAEDGVYLAFDVVGGMGTPPELRTYTGQRGTDRRHLLPPLSTATGTLTNPSLTYDWAEEKTAVYAGGQGEEEDRIIQTAVDADRVGQSYWGRQESFVYATQGETAAAVLAEARAGLQAGRPRQVFTADFTDSMGVQYGRDLNFGDQVQAAGFGKTFDVRVDAVDLQVSSDGLETVGVVLRSEAPL